ncbi:SPOR domain-containing protein [Candidimonas sp. SYP-B2681]|uniref:SPOR domain-containing protein n=1 Tax=Candidimonas sp. SYP-B2681 TaxID=2497686 RepID=UPI000F8930EA|nr:SPOR domain-containing protein [Candidimonas sp. SYP-B2681]RTZ47931.1 SPOR domain-containing protein [Candidimonas sp. SYP-B2681]
MGLFSRNESAAGSGRRPVSRSSQSSEAQAGELRGRARRRLIGALALVLAAVIIVPMLFDSSAPPDQISTPVVVPAIVPPAPDTSVGVAIAPSEPTTDQAASVNLTTPGTATGQTAGEGTVATPSTLPDTGVSAAAPPVPSVAAPEPAPKPKATEKPVAKPEPKPAAERTDDGSVAIALLEGRTPSKPVKAASKGSFTLQIAAYTSDKDAQTRRERLVAAGVTNTYVENAVSGGKTTYRLRVGPFPTREAAQAAQARLRALGYDNGFISTK